MTQCDMELTWRKGTDHAVPDALFRLRRTVPRELEIDTPFQTTPQVDLVRRAREDLRWTVSPFNPFAPHDSDEDADRPEPLGGAERSTRQGYLGQSQIAPDDIQDGDELQPATHMKVQVFMNP